MNDDALKLYGALQKYGYRDLGTADEFGTKLQDSTRRRKLYDALSRDGFKDLGTFDEFSARLTGSSSTDIAETNATATSATTTDAAAPAGTPGSRERMENAQKSIAEANEGYQMFNQRRNAMRPATSPIPEAPAKEPEPSEPANPFPYRKEDSFEEELNTKLADLKSQKREIDNALAGDDQLIEEYERRLKEHVRSLDPTSRKAKEDEQWLREHKDAYNQAKSSEQKKESERLKGEISKIENAQAAAENDAARKANRELMASPSEVVARGLTPFGRDNTGREDKEYAYRAAADELYAQAEQEHRKPNKYDENAGTFVDQYAEGAGNNIDRGSLTMGLSEGSEAVTARKVGDHYNEVVSSTLKDLGVSDADITADMVTMETSGKRLEKLNEEAERMGPELEAMKSTYEDMARRGDPRAEAYGRQLNKKIDEYNKWLEKDYKPVRESYDTAKERYDKVMGAIDDRIAGELSDGEMTVLDALEKFTKAKMLRSDDVSVAAKAGAGAEQSAEFMLDFYLTGGLTEAGTRAATKLTTKHLLRKFGKDAVKEMAAKGTINPSMWSKIATDAAVSAARTSLMVTRNLQSYGDNLTEYVGRDSAGRFNFDRSHLNAALNTALTQYIEYWSEGFGEYFGAGEQALFKNVTKSAPKAAIGQTLKGYRGSIGQYLDKGKFDGMLNEMLEEVVGSAFNSLAGWMSNDRVGDEGALKDFFAGENIANLALSFLPMTAISTVTNIGAYHDMKRRYDKAVEGLKPFIESGTISQQELKHLSLNLSEMTPKEVTKKMEDMADRARKSNGGKLPADFAQNLLGYLEGDFAMSLRNDEWEASQEKMAVVNAYSSYYANPNPREAWDVDQNYKAATKAAVDAGFNEEELDDKDSWLIAQDALELRIDDPARADVLMDYATAKASVDGLRKGYENQTQQVNEARDAAVRKNLDVDGTVTTATINTDEGPKQVFILSEDTTVGPDGKITTPTGDGLVAYREDENGEAKTAKASEFSEAASQTTDSYIQETNDLYTRQRAAVYEQGATTVSPSGQMRSVAQNVGQSVVVTDEQGVYQPVTVERMTRGCQSAVISSKDKKALQGIAKRMGLDVPPSNYLEVPVARLWPILQKEADNYTLTTFNQETAANNEAGQAEAPQAEAEQVPEVKTGEQTIMLDNKPTTVRVFRAGNDGVMFEDPDGNDRSMTLTQFQQAMQQAAAPAEAQAVQEQAPVQEQKPAFPVNEETGEKIYDHPSVTPEAAYQEIMGDAKPGSTNEANRIKAIDRARSSAWQDYNIAEASLAKAQRERAQVDEWNIPDDESLDAFEQRKARARADADARIAELERQLPELKRKAEHWDAVQGLVEQRAQQAAADKAERTRKKVVNRARKWEKMTGVKVEFIDNEADVKKVSRSAAADIKRGKKEGYKIYGWYNPQSDKVYIYTPSFDGDLSEIDKTYIHEVVTHKGLRGLLTDPGYDELCDRVWNELMTDEQRAFWKDDYNSHLKGKGHDEKYLQRAAADEYIAYLSEHLNEGENKSLFDKIVEWVKDILDRLMSSDDIEAEAKEKVAAAESITTDLLKELLADSMARFVQQKNGAKPLSTESLKPEIQEEMKEKGLEMDGGVVMDEQQTMLKRATDYKTPNELDEVADPVVGDIRFSRGTMPAWEQTYRGYENAREHVIKVLNQLKDRIAVDELVSGVTPRGTYKYGEKSSGSFSGPLRTNIEYIVTFDMDTSCPRSLQYLEYVKKIERQIGRPLTQRESVQLIEMMRVYGQMIPCVYCYCENKRQALKQYFTNFMESRHAVLSAETDEEALDAMYGHATGAKAEGSRDPKVALTKAAYDVFKKWRSDRSYNPTMKQLWSEYNNDRNILISELDYMLDSGKVSTLMTDEEVTKAVCQALGIDDKAAQGAVGDIVSEWKWNRIEDVPHEGYTPVDEDTDTRIDQRALSLWREMTLYGKSASSAKNVLRYVPYTDELKDLDQEQKDYINGMGGLRMHSSNDFRIDYFLDYLQFMADMEVNGMMGHTYTKSPEFVRIFGNSGYKINMSIAAYEDSRGIHPNPQEGFDWNEAKELREKFPNAGVMLMATSDNQIQLALDSDWIDMFIPFHHSGLPKEIWYQMRHWDDYTASQNEKFLNTDERKKALKADGVEIPKGAKAAEVEKLYNEHFGIIVETYVDSDGEVKRIRPHFLPGKTVVNGVEIPGHNNDLQTYLDLCRRYGVHPRFYGVKVKDNTPEGGGREVDITEHPQYMKCIKETARTDSPQTAIHFNFDEPSPALDGMSPIDYALRELEARAHAETEMAGSPVRSIYESYKQDPYGIVQQYINTIIKHKEETGEDYPLDYLTPDSRQWFMTERKALEDAYKDFDTIPYHPHEYDEDGNLIMTDAEGNPEEEVGEDGEWIRTRKVTSPVKITELEKGPKVKVYRSMQFVPDPNGDVEYDLGDGKGMQKGFLYAPMSAKVNGEWREPIQLNRWEEAEENPDMADENGDFILDKGDGSGPMKVAYAPYLHTRRSPLNEQFSSAYKRPNLVIVESDVPESELTSGYTADKSKKSTGEHDWSSGKVSNALAKRGLDTRKVILSRWAKPVRIVPNSEVADEIVNLMGKRKLSFPYNVVTPSLRAELIKRGVKFSGWQGNKPKNVDELIAGMKEEDEGRDDIRFSKVIDRIKALPDDQPVLSDEEKAEIGKTNETFNEKLANTTEENIESQKYSLGKPGSILRDAGVADKEMILYGPKLKSKAKLHGFHYEDIKDLPSLINEPIAVFNNHEKEGNRSILTDVKVGDDNMLVAVNVGKGNDIDFNIIATITGKRGDSVVGWLEDELDTYVNKKKALDYLQLSAPIAVSTDNSELSSGSKGSENSETYKENEVKFRKAPNGKESNLTEEQWETVRTPEFKAWFGDWENDPENASKVVDANGEPLVVYHGTSANEEFTVFKAGYFAGPIGKFGSKYADEMAKDTAKSFSVDPLYKNLKGNGRERVYSVFLNIRNPFVVEDVGGHYWDATPLTDEQVADGVPYDEEFDWTDKNGKVYHSGYLNDVVGWAKKKGIYDGVIAPQVEENGGMYDAGMVDDYVPFAPGQIKSATDNNGQFDPNNPDIRYRKVTPEQDAEYMAAVEAGDMAKAEQMVRDAAKAAGYNSTKLYHGTDAFGFTQIDNNAKGADGHSFWATDKEDVSATYTKYGKRRRVKSDLTWDDMDRYAEDVSEKMDDAISDFRHLIDRTFDPWFFGQQSNRIIREAVDKANPKPGEGDGVYDALLDMVADAYDDYGEDFDQYEDFADWQESSPEFEKIETAIVNIEAIRGKLADIDTGDLLGGIYELYANTDNMFVVDAKGENWNNLHPEGLPKIVKGQYKDVPYKTRDVSNWALQNGYDGVIFKNIVDSGRYGETPASDVYAFFNPTAQVKSADPVTYDENGEVIPLSKRFNPESNDIRFRREIDPESQELFDAAKERFGTTNDVREAGYVLPDGTMLDFSGRHWSKGSDNSWMNGMRQVDHRDIQDLNYEEDGNTPTGRDTNMSDFIRRGAIRISFPGAINLSTKPTWSQEEVLERLIRRNNRFVRVDFGDGNRSDHYADYDYAAPSKIISDIDDYFDYGTKPDGDARYRKTEEQVEKEQRVAAAEQEYTDKTIDAMTPVIGTGVRRVSRNDMPKGHKSDKGWYNPVANTVSVCMDNVTDERDAVATVLHETVGRNGLRELFGEQFQDMMARIYGNLDNAGRAWVNGYIRRNNLQLGDGAIVRGMMEYLSGLAERMDSGLDAVNDVLGEVIDDLFGTDGFRFTDRELAYMLRAGFEHMKNPNWLDTPAGKAKDTLMKRELGINESDPNRPTDPEGPDAGTRYRKGDTGVASADYNTEMLDKMNLLVMEHQNADLPVKIGMEKVMKEIGKERLEDEENYLVRHNIASSRAETEAHDYKLFHFDPLLDKVREVQDVLLDGSTRSRDKEETYQKILDYLYAVSGLERNEWERNNGGEAKDWSGLTSLTGHPKEEWQGAEDDARAMVDAFKAEVGNDDLLDQLWDAIRSCTDFTLDHALKYGLITQEEYDRLHGKEKDGSDRLWKYYLPLRGFNEKTAEETFSYAGLMARDAYKDSDVLKGAKGRWTQADNPIANILNIAQREIAQGNENWAREALYRFALNAGQNSLLSVRKPWYEKVPGTTNKWRLAVPEDIDPTTGRPETIESFEKRMREMKERGEARQGRKGLKLDMIMTSKAHQNQHLIKFKVGGEDKMIWVNGDPAFARAVSGFGRKAGWELTRAASRVLSNMFTTYSLDFTAKNLIRDTIYSRLALMMKEPLDYRWKFFKNWWVNFGGGAFAFPMVRLAYLWESGKLQQKENLSEREQMFIDFMHDGGQTGYSVMNSVEQIKRDLDIELGGAKRSLFNRLPSATELPVIGVYATAVKTLNEAFELLTRFTAYQTSRDMGRSGQQSAYDAKEISVNFNRRGAQSGEGLMGQIAAYLGATHYFYNAGVQGFDNFLRLFKANPKRMTPAAVGLIGMGILTPLINSMLAGGGDGDDDKWYWNLPEWVRRNNIILGWKDKDKVDENGNPVKKNGASYFAIPLPVEFRAFYGLGDIAASAFVYHKYPDPSFGRVAGDMLSTAMGVLPFNPIEDAAGSTNAADMMLRAAVPDVTMFWVDWATNHDYTGRPLAKENLFGKETVPKSQGAYASTPLALVKACQALGMVTGWDIPPGVARDFMNNYLGGFYKVAEDISKRMFTDDEHTKRWDDIPFLSGFTGHIDEDRTDTYVKNVLNAYRDKEEGAVRDLNLRLMSKDVTEDMAYNHPDQVLAMAKNALQRALVERILESEDWELGKMYYDGTKDEGTGEYQRVTKTYKTGKRAGRQYKRKEEIKIPGTESLKRKWNEKKKEWAAMPEDTPEQRSAKADTLSSVQDLWHKYYDAQAALAEKLMNKEYDK